jgi:hypothetical protein
MAVYRPIQIVDERVKPRSVREMSRELFHGYRVLHPEQEDLTAMQ